MSDDRDYDALEAGEYRDMADDRAADAREALRDIVDLFEVEGSSVKLPEEHYDAFRKAILRGKEVLEE